MKKKKIIIILFCAILFLFIGVSITLNILVDHVNTISVSNLDLADITDGTYIGEYSITPVYVKVQVSVKEHKLTDIKILEHRKGLGGKAEEIVDTIINGQSLEVDAISGATVSSKCILKAVEHALQNEYR